MNIDEHDSVWALWSKCTFSAFSVLYHKRYCAVSFPHEKTFFQFRLDIMTLPRIYMDLCKTLKEKILENVKFELFGGLFGLFRSISFHSMVFFIPVQKWGVFSLNKSSIAFSCYARSLSCMKTRPYYFMKGINFHWTFPGVCWPPQFFSRKKGLKMPSS